MDIFNAIDYLAIGFSLYAIALFAVVYEFVSSKLYKVYPASFILAPFLPVILIVSMICYVIIYVIVGKFSIAWSLLSKPVMAYSVILMTMTEVLLDSAVLYQVIFEGKNQKKLNFAEMVQMMKMIIPRKSHNNISLAGETPSVLSIITESINRFIEITKDVNLGNESQFNHHQKIV